MKLELNYPASEVYERLTTIQSVRFSNTNIQPETIISAQTIPQSRFAQFSWRYKDCLGQYDGGSFNTTSSYQFQNSNFEKFVQLTATDQHSNVVSSDLFLSKLPVVYIDVDGGHEIDSKDISYGCNIRVQGNWEYTNQYEGRAEIHGRGSSSWRYYTKKSYKLKLDKKFNMFGFGSNKHWVLVSCFVDNTFMRNIYAQDAARTLGLAYSKMTPVTVILNGTCIGVYVLAQHVRIGNGTVNIFDWEDEAEKTGHSDTSYRWVDNDSTITVDGGFLYGLENDTDKEISEFQTNGGMNVVINKPESAITSHKMMTFSQNLLNGFEEACQSYGGFNSSGQHFSDIADISTMVKYLLINLVLGNVDARYRSRYCYIERGGKLKFGPVWDFDRALGSVMNEDFNLNTAYWNCFLNSKECVYQDWVSHPYFCHLLRQEWLTNLRPWIVQLLAKLDSDKSSLLTVGAMNDIVRQDDTIVHPYVGTYDLRGYSSDCDYTKQWLTNRLTWLDQKFASNLVLSASLQQRYAKYPILSGSSILCTVNSGTPFNLDNTDEIQVNSKTLSINISSFGSYLNKVLVYKDTTYIGEYDNIGFTFNTSIDSDKNYAIITLVEKDTTNNTYSKVGFATIHYVS